MQYIQYMNNLPKNYPEIIISMSGLSAIAVVCLGLYFSLTGYMGDDSYSPVNHFISELGLDSATTNAYIFNNSLMLGGLLLFTFIIALGNYLPSGMPVRVATMSGMIATLGFSTVGYFTADDWIPHLIAASVFFFGAVIAISLFTWAIWRDQQMRFHSSIVLQGILILVIYFVALLWPKEMLYEMANNPATFVRPSFWILPILEWSYCLMLGAWIVMISLNLIYVTLSAPVTKHTLQTQRR